MNLILPVLENVQGVEGGPGPPFFRNCECRFNMIVYFQDHLHLNVKIKGCKTVCSNGKFTFLL